MDRPSKELLAKARFILHQMTCRDAPLALQLTETGEPYIECIYCNDVSHVYSHERWENVEHAHDCPVMRARALVAEIELHGNDEQT